MIKWNRYEFNWKEVREVWCDQDDEVGDSGGKEEVRSSTLQQNLVQKWKEGCKWKMILRF